MVDRDALWAECDILLKVRAPRIDEIDEVSALREGATTISFLYPVQNRPVVEKLAARLPTTPRGFIDRCAAAFDEWLVGGDGGEDGLAVALQLEFAELAGDARADVGDEADLRAQRPNAGNFSD